MRPNHGMCLHGRSLDEACHECIDSVGIVTDRSSPPCCAAPLVWVTNGVGYTKEALLQRLKDDEGNLRESEVAVFFIERWLKKLK